MMDGLPSVHASRRGASNRRLKLSLLLLVLCCGTTAFAVEPARLVLIIDDLGNNYPLSQRAIELPGSLTVAILPQLANTARLAKNAHATGKEIILHAPMSSLHDTPLGPGAMTSTMSHEQLIAVLRDDIASVPFVSGVNNHMGSALTADADAMLSVMTELRSQQLYFVDSRTHANTVAAERARELSLPNLERKVFLDNNTDEQAIAKQFQRWLQFAKRDGMAVAIGHPYPETLAFLERQLPLLDSEEYQLITPSQLFPHAAWQRAEQAEEAAKASLTPPHHIAAGEL
ncbi:hypothetical protein EDC56_3115 [Sinobacterium caligoides]|uniref:Divergent polysaccharide deacetylase n=1 Tax=Sinobacterium caligoides TaxID=933926 RepID=A0A3N2DGV3_9GAMM|nr:divergent polysaccharide deacetylase family protein [Sinobacterium caligoides]ROR98878.1 hypothetical protein EDC56_3115 [Sinobacterium caligoides]